MPLLSRTKYRRPTFPDGQIVLLHDPLESVQQALVNETYDGPYEPNTPGGVAYDPDGTTVLLSEGAPYPLPVVKQEGDLLHLEGGIVYRIDKWQ